MKRSKLLDDLTAKYADALARGGRTSRGTPGLHFKADAERGEEGKVLMNTIEKLHEALRPMPVPESLAVRVREQVRQEIAGRVAPVAPAGAGGFVAGLQSAAQAFIRRAGEVVLNINVGELLRGRRGAQAAQPAVVYAYSVVEALDKAARRRKARILLDARGGIYEVPDSVLKRYAVQARTRRGQS